MDLFEAVKKRYNFRALVIHACCFLFFFPLSACSQISQAGQPRQPNIIYINTDDWGIGKVPCYRMDPASERIIKTPNIDRLASEGMRFTNAYSGNAVCGPSRCTLLSGIHPGRAVFRANRKSLPNWPPETPLLGEVARKAGYTTAAFGKISGGGTETPEDVNNAGWDYWLGFLGHVDCRDYYASQIWENGVQIPLPKNSRETLAGTEITLPQGERKHAPRDVSKHPKEKGTGVVPEGTGTFIEDLYADKIIEFMETNKSKPFFIYYASTVPHGGPPGRMRVPSLEGYDKVEGLTMYEQLYCALLTRHDRNVGRLMDAVKRLGIENNTIIIWTSDNGDESSYYGYTETFDGNGHFRGVKRSLYEGGIRVPMIAWWPGTIEAGTTCDLITTQCDVMPTVADLGGAEITKVMDGISIAPTLSGKPEKQTDRKYIYFEFYETGPQQSVRMGKWKAYRRDGTKGTLELYDLSNDISEQNDLAAEHPDIVKEMEQIMINEHTEHPVWKIPGLDD